MHIQDMTFRIVVSTETHLSNTKNVLRLVNQNDEVIIEHPITSETLNEISGDGDYNSDAFKKAAAAYLCVCYLYTRDYPEGKGAASYDFHRTAGIILDQFVVDEGLGEFEADDWGRTEVLVPGTPEGIHAFAFSNDGSDLNLRIYRPYRGVIMDRLFTYSDEDLVPDVLTLIEVWDEAVVPEVSAIDEQAARISFADVHFTYALDMSKEGRELRQAFLQVVIGERLVCQQKIHENTQPLMYYMMEVFNMLALRMSVGFVATINAEDRVTLLNAISGFVGGHLAMPDQVQIQEGMQYAHEGTITPEVSYMLSHELLSNNQLKATYQFNTMVDDTMRRSITMVNITDYLEDPLTPLAFFSEFQADLTRELKLTQHFDIAMIAAIDRGNGLGKDNELLFRIKEDLQYFKSCTEYTPIIMGRKTFQSLPNPLPNRLNIVLTTEQVDKHTTMSGVRYVNSKEEALAVAANYLTEEGGNKIWVIGGASIYAMFLADAKELHLTTINADREDADTFFPEVNMSHFLASRQFDADQSFVREGEEISYNRFVLTRK